MVLRCIWFGFQNSAQRKRNADAQAFSLGKKRVARASQQDIVSNCLQWE